MPVPSDKLPPTANPRVKDIVGEAQVAALCPQVIVEFQPFEFTEPNIAYSFAEYLTVDGDPVEVPAGARGRMTLTFTELQNRTLQRGPDPLINPDSGNDLSAVTWGDLFFLLEEGFDLLYGERFGPSE